MADHCVAFGWKIVLDDAGNVWVLEQVSDIKDEVRHGPFPSVVELAKIWVASEQAEIESMAAELHARNHPARRVH